MQLTLDATDSRPIYVRIVDEIRRGLARGTLGPEDAGRSGLELADLMAALKKLGEGSGSDGKEGGAGGG